MITQELTICGKVVSLAYCYATEIAYKELAGENIIDYIKEALDYIADDKDPDPKRTILAITASICAYYDGRNEDVPVTATELMTDATPSEVANALAAVLSLRARFYHVPAGEPFDNESACKKRKGKRKN